MQPQTPVTHNDQLTRFADADESVTILGASVRPTASRHGIAIDAIGKEKPFAVDTAGQYLTTLAETFESFELEEPSNGLLDAKVLAAIEAFQPYLDEYRQFLVCCARHPDSVALATPIAAFFDAILVTKKPGRDTQEPYLWADGYRFILRELFLTTIAILIRFECHAAALVLIETRYRGADPAGDSFVVFDSYVKTLDEFRNRRLQLQRLSVSADLIQERADANACSFDEMMQADFVLCVRGLIHQSDFFARWHPRTLVFAERFALTGFDLFVTAADRARFGPLATLLSVKNRNELVRRFETVCDQWDLDNWELGGLPLDFRGFMGLTNPALVG